MLYERGFLLAILLAIFTAIPVASIATVSPEREFLTAHYQANAPVARRQRIKQRRRQLGTLKSYVRYPSANLRSHLSRVPVSLRNIIGHVEHTWGQVEIVSACRPGATFVQGGRRHPSWHAQCRAVDFIPPAKHRKAVLAYVKRNTPGFVLTYRTMAHIHIDNAREGRYAIKSKTYQRAIIKRKGPAKASIPAKPSQVAAIIPLPPVRPPLASDLASLDTQALPVALYSLPEPAPALAPIRPQDSRNIFALDEAREYLARTASIGGTMLRQGPALAIERLHPQFTVRLAAAIKHARQKGLPKAAVFSAYRPPAFGIGGFNDKFRSLHAYGLAADISGIGRPGSSESRLWNRIALAHKIYSPYGPSHRAEWNHYSPSWTRAIDKYEPLRKTITARGPIDLPTMWRIADRLIDNTTHKIVRIGKKKIKYAKRYAGKKWSSLKKRWKKHRGHV